MVDKNYYIPLQKKKSNVLLRQNRIVGAVYKILEGRQGENKKTVTKLKPGTKSETSLGDSELVQDRRDARNTRNHLRRWQENPEELEQ